MIKGISYWSFTGGLDGTAPVAQVFRQAASLGYESVEVCLSASGDVSLDTTEASARSIRDAAEAAGIRISSVATGLFWDTSLSASDPTVRARALHIGRKLIDVAHWLDAGAVLVIPGAVDVFFSPDAEVRPFQEVWDAATESIGALEPHAAAAGIAIGLENVWNRFLTGPAELAQFIDQFHSPWIGSYFDVGNCMVQGYPEHWITYLGSRIKRVHFKDFRRAVGTADGFVDLLSGDVNWPAVIQALQAIGYDSYVTAEMIPLYTHYPDVLLQNTSCAMDAILGR